MKKNIVVALSGGVDSSVSALLLKKMGYNVIGIFIKIFNKNFGYCNWNRDSIDAMIISEKIGIPFYIIDLSKQYKEYVLKYIYNEYSIGRTPNPDVICNEKIKFDYLLKKAFYLGANKIATGHYAKIKKIKKNKKKIYSLFCGKDEKKDQSYFLCKLNQYQLSKIIFPLGELNKKKVRKIAFDYGLINYDKKDSQGICFIGKIKLPFFLKKKIKEKKGKIIKISKNSIIYDIYKKNISFITSKIKLLYFLSKKIVYKKEYGEVIGYHNGAFSFTIGQRKGLKIGGYKKPLFVINTNILENNVYVGMGKYHPGLYKKVIFLKKKRISWLRNDLIKNNKTMKIKCRIRYRQKLQNAYLYNIYNGIFIEFEKMQKSVTNGQFVVWYNKYKELIGSGII
ncbi:tRNA 2-thiouridine(34) synthase MnmA [Candidatus Shikimatogenerans silvanidophilus]|uniref:tRNA 2-thiouridine(34) synthase MnmA n=1 Tax=Candidatus Shikimatogenerans silvanidophilus TaxID=2782547 RepID=UPI001BAA31A7|nr:tRNA 2-thiouridine(34) synthase MnmA [Candidatus Shikimatogenerans silvanidophilus]